MVFLFTARTNDKITDAQLHPLMFKCRFDPTHCCYGLNDYRISYGTLGIAPDGFSVGRGVKG